MATDTSALERSASSEEKERIKETGKASDDLGQTNSASNQVPGATPALSPPPSAKKGDEEAGEVVIPAPQGEDRWLAGSRLVVVHSAMMLSCVFNDRPPVSRAI
jgi:hypothetical protein